MIYEKALAEHKRLEEQINELEQQLKEYPEAGKKFCREIGSKKILILSNRGNETREKSN